MSDEELLSKARAGDRAAFDALVARHRERLRRFVVVMSGDDGEDLVAEAVARAFAELPRFEGRSAFSTWLTGIALNLCRHARRKRREEAADLDARPARRGVLSSVYRRELAERMDLALERLPASMREAFVLRFVEKMEYDEIASITGTTPGAARVRAHRARTLMKGELGPSVDTYWREGDERSTD